MYYPRPAIEPAARDGAIFPRADNTAPRAAGAFSYAEPHHGPVTGFGIQLNLTSAAASYTHGLDGVHQTANWLFANALLVFFMGLLAATMIYRWIHMGKSHMRHLFTMGRREDQRYWMRNHTQLWPRIKQKLLLAPLGRQRHNKEIQLSQAISIGTLPSRFHTVLLVLYCASNIAYCLVLDWSNSTSAAVVADLRGRTGILAALNLIPTVLFALRNNPLIPILRVSYDTFNLLHRWCARIVVLESIVHSACWAANTISAGGMHDLHSVISTSVSYQWGLVATCIFTFIVITASSPIRHAFYETFLNAHRLLVAVALAGVYVHLDKANLPQLPYVQLCIAFWCAEWLWRSARICYYNVSRRKGVTKVTVEALPGEACRVTFELSRPWRWQPGCHVHAYLPAFALWSSHPFSVAWAENRPNGLPREIEMGKLPSASTSGMLSPTSRHASLMVRNSPLGKDAAGVATITEVTDDLPQRGGDDTDSSRDAPATSISLVMRARTGMTRALYDRAAKSPRGILHTWGALEGPYGGHEPLTSYGTAVLFAGGVGITHCVGHVRALLRHWQAGTSSTRRVLLVWSVPTTEALEWVRPWMDEILQMDGRRDVLRVHLFVTRPRHRGEVVSGTGSVQMFPGRCHPHTVLEKEMRDRVGAVGVTVCGPGAFADSVRAAVRQVVTLGAVDFVEEAFTY